MRPMKILLLIVATSAALAAPGLARATETPSPAVAACYAQYQQLGATGFTAKYGTGDAGKKACLQANGGTTDAKPVTDDVTRTVVAYMCSSESSEAGKRACLQTKLAQAQALVAGCRSTAGTAKGAVELCIKQALGVAAKTKDNTEKAGNAEKAAKAACEAEVKTLGYDAFQQKYGRGKDGLAACLRTKR
jgi:hypothetical protein